MDVPVRGLPHEEVLDDAPHRLPWEVVPLDVVELLAMFLQPLVEEVGLGGRPVLELVPAEDWAGGRHEGADGVRQAVPVPMQLLVRVEDGDVARGRGRADVQARLLHRRRAVQRTGERAN